MIRRVLEPKETKQLLDFEKESLEKIQAKILYTTERVGEWFENSMRNVDHNGESRRDQTEKHLRKVDDIFFDWHGYYFTDIEFVLEYRYRYEINKLIDKIGDRRQLIRISNDKELVGGTCARCNNENDQKKEYIFPYNVAVPMIAGALNDINECLILIVEQLMKAFGCPPFGDTEIVELSYEEQADCRLNAELSKEEWKARTAEWDRQQGNPKKPKREYSEGEGLVHAVFGMDGVERLREQEEKLKKEYEEQSLGEVKDA